MLHIKNYLQDNPHVGVLSGVGSGIVLEIRTLLTDELTLKIVAGVAAWAGCFVAVLSLIVYAIKVHDIIKNRIKKLKARKHENIIQ